MKLIKRDTDYAIRALCYIALKDGTVTAVTELINELGVPRPFIRKILQALTKEEILVSYKGKGGGFKLAKPPGKIRLKDVMEVLQGQFTLSECLIRDKLCPEIKTCELRKKLEDIKKDVEKKIEKITILSLIEKHIRR